MPRTRTSSRAFAAAFVAALAGCGGSAVESPSPSAPSPSPAASPAAQPSAAAPEPPREAAPAADASSPRPVSPAELDAGIRKLDDVRYEIDRALVDRLLADPAAIAASARIVPAIKDGTPDGFKLYAIRLDSLFARLGFLNGDTVHAINGQDVSSPDRMLEAYVQIRDASTLAFALSRRGQPVTLTYTIK